MILYQECKRLDKVKGRQEVVDGKLRDQCMLCEFYEMCNSCFFFGSSNAEKEAAISDMVVESVKESVKSQNHNYDIDINASYHKPIDHYIATSDVRKAAILDCISGKGPTIKNEFIFNKTKSEMVSDPKRYAEARIEALKQKRGK